MAQSSRTFRIFVSSTFSDLKSERNALQEKVFPRLSELVRGIPVILERAGNAIVKVNGWRKSVKILISCDDFPDQSGYVKVNCMQ